MYLKTIFCCMACDGEIAREEIDVVRRLASVHELFSEVGIKSCLNDWIAAMNEDGGAFLNAYLNELSAAGLSSSEQLFIVDLAIQTIEADKRIEYSEIKFFKKIRCRLSVSDEEILEKHPDKGDFLLPDVQMAEEPGWNKNIQFAEISLSL